MHAAVVSSFDTPPAYAEFPDPSPRHPSELVVDVLAAALSMRVVSQADGTHYTSTDVLPFVPGIDGVGRTDDGVLRYFVLPDTALGSMADRTVIDERRSVVLPGDVDPVTVAAAMNPVMSSWIALRRRVALAPGARVLILGATGTAGGVAAQVAKLSGASRVVAVGRDAARLEATLSHGADETVSLAGDPDEVAANLGRAGSEVDVVLDYLWGDPAAAALRAIVPARVDDAQELAWIQIGSIAGHEAAIPSAALRAANLRIVGSGQGSVSPRDILAELPAMAAEIARGTFAVGARPMPLADVTEAWRLAPTTSERIVLVP